MVERGGLENRCGGNPTQGSNPCLSATSFEIIHLYQLLKVILRKDWRILPANRQSGSALGPISTLAILTLGAACFRVSFFRDGDRAATNNAQAAPLAFDQVRPAQSIVIGVCALARTVNLIGSTHPQIIAADDAARRHVQ